MDQKSRISLGAPPAHLQPGQGDPGSAKCLARAGRTWGAPAVLRYLGSSPTQLGEQAACHGGTLGWGPGLGSWPGPIMTANGSSGCVRHEKVGHTLGKRSVRHRRGTTSAIWSLGPDSWLCHSFFCPAIWGRVIQALKPSEKRAPSGHPLVSQITRGKPRPTKWESSSRGIRGRHYYSHHYGHYYYVSGFPLQAQSSDQNSPPPLPAGEGNGGGEHLPH